MSETTAPDAEHPPGASEPTVTVHQPRAVARAVYLNEDGTVANVELVDADDPPRREGLRVRLVPDGEAADAVPGARWDGEAWSAPDTAPAPATAEADAPVTRQEHEELKAHVRTLAELIVSLHGGPEVTAAAQAETEALRTPTSAFSLRRDRRGT